MLQSIVRREPRFSHLETLVGSDKHDEALSASPAPADEPDSNSPIAAAAAAEEERAVGVGPSLADIDATLEQVQQHSYITRIYDAHSLQARMTTMSLLQVPTSWCVVGLCVSTVSCTVVLSTFFGLPAWQVRSLTCVM